MMILSIDLGKFQSVCCFYEKETGKHRFETIKTNRAHVKNLLDKNPCEIVIMEACGPSGWISDVCRSRDIKSLICSTNEEAWSWKSVKRKTDRDDARRLAQMYVHNTLVPVYMPEPAVREQRMIIKYRKTLDQRINRVKNTIRSLFANHGIEIDTGARAWCTGRVHIDSFRKAVADCGPLEIWKAELDLELTQLDDLTEKLQSIEDKLDSFAATNPHIIRLMTIPGVGRITAEALVAAIDDPHRFKNARQLSSYLGLTPKQYQSGETDRNGRISKRGPRLLRTLLLQCAWCSLRYNTWSKTTFERIHGGSKSRRKKAAIALARKIGVVAWAMMRDETDWDQSKLLDEATLDATAEASEETKQEKSPEKKSPTKKPKAKLKRALPHPPGPVIAEPPKHPTKPGSKRKSRRGSGRRSPMKT